MHESHPTQITHTLVSQFFDPYTHMPGKRDTGALSASINSMYTEATDHVGLQGWSRTAVWDGRDDGAPTAQAGGRAVHPSGGVPPVW